MLATILGMSSSLDIENIEKRKNTSGTVWITPSIPPVDAVDEYCSRKFEIHKMKLVPESVLRKLGYARPYHSKIK